MPRRPNRGPSIGLSETGGIRHGLQLSVQPSIKQDEESESCGLDGSAMPGPCIRILAGRTVQPVSGIGESLVQDCEIGVARLVVAVESKVGGLRIRFGTPAKNEKCQNDRGTETESHPLMLHARLLRASTSSTFNLDRAVEICSLHGPLIRK